MRGSVDMASRRLGRVHVPLCAIELLGHSVKNGKHGMLIQVPATEIFMDTAIVCYNVGGLSCRVAALE